MSAASDPLPRVKSVNGAGEVDAGALAAGPNHVEGEGGAAVDDPHRSRHFKALLDRPAGVPQGTVCDYGSGVTWP